MKALNTTLLTFATMLLIAVTCTGATASPRYHQTHYRVINFPSLGGTSSGGIGINNRGLVTGFSTLADGQTIHAAAWLYGVPLDLGTLGGPNSAVLWPVKNNHGVIVGVSQTSTPDPLGESWSCAAFIPASENTCVGFAWQWGTMRALPTLGGNNGFATGVNNRGQIVGWAENAVHDPTCNPPQVLQFEAVVWGPGEDQLRQLQPFGNDPDSAATAINNRGDVVGISGKCSNAVGGASAIHALLWHSNGSITNLGNLGGKAWNTPMAINNRGQIVGFSNVSGDETSGVNFQAFLWTPDRGMQNLHALPGGTISEALDVNDSGQIVGVSYGGPGCGDGCAFIWERGKMTNLNDRIAAGSPNDLLLYANSINEAGEITGAALDQSTGDTVTFLAIPTDD